MGEKQGTRVYYGAYSRKGTADTIALAKQMSEGSSSFTKGEVVGITLDLPRTIKQALLNGEAVRIDGLGTFKPSLHTDKVQEKKEDLKTNAISIAGINFTPDPKFLMELNSEAEFVWIDARQASTEDDGTTDMSPTPSGSNTGGTSGGSSTGGGSTSPYEDIGID